MRRSPYNYSYHSTIQGGPKSKPLPNYQKIVLKPANEIRISTYFLTSVTMPDPQPS